MRRAQKVAAVLAKELALMITDALDSNFGVVTLTHADVQADLKEAKIYISCLEPKFEEKAIKTLTAKTRDFQQVLSKRLKMKFTPKIIFLVDSGWEEVDKIGRLLAKVSDGVKNDS